LPDITAGYAYFTFSFCRCIALYKACRNWHRIAYSVLMVRR